MHLQQPSAEKEGKIGWSGRVLSIQPRIGLLRSFDQRSHSYRGFVLWIEGMAGGTVGAFHVAIGKGAQEKHGFRVGDSVSGSAEPVKDRRIELAELYKVSRLQVIARGDGSDDRPPPWHLIPPALEVYRQRGHRRLDEKTYEAKCRTCMWGCRMAVEIIIDQWSPERKKYRTETFCYGPRSCAFYKAGPTRKVPGRRGMTWEEEDWVDDEAVAHRAMDE